MKIRIVGVIKNMVPVAQNEGVRKQIASVNRMFGPNRTLATGPNI